MSATTTLAPSSANRIAEVLPIPEVAPMMTATFPTSFFSTTIQSPLARKSEFIQEEFFSEQQHGIPSLAT